MATLKILVEACQDFGFFKEFLGCVLIRNCVWANLGFFCGLKEGFYGEVKCEFLG